MLGMRLDWIIDHFNMNGTYPHRKFSNSFFSTFLNRESLKALIRAYSAMPS